MDADLRFALGLLALVAVAGVAAALCVLAERVL